MLQIYIIYMLNQAIGTVITVPVLIGALVATSDADRFVGDQTGSDRSSGPITPHVPEDFPPHEIDIYSNRGDTLYRSS